jgi:hypothetical protein
MSMLEELQAKAKAILEYCEGWKKCQDGSYEMALLNSGYDKVLKEIKDIRDMEQSK